MTLDDQLTAAAALQQAGRFAEANDAFLQLLPQLQQRAMLDPSPRWSVILGEIQLKLDRPAEALATLKLAATQYPDSADVHGAIGHVLERQSNWAAAEEAYSRALSINPELAEARCNLGHVLCRQGRWPAAMLELQTALQFSPTLAPAHFHLATAQKATGRLSAAADSFRRTAGLQPSLTAAWEALGDVLLELRDRTGAVAAYQRACELNPVAMNRLNLGAALAAIDDVDAAIEQMQLAVVAEPTWSDAYKGLGQALYRAGELDDAINAFEKAVELDPTNDAADSHALYCRLFRGTDAPIELRHLHERWADRHTRDIAPLPPAIVDPSPDRRLRVGYVSPNFRNQAVVLFVLPILENHDPWEVEVFCYSDAHAADAWTMRCREAVDEWRDTADLSHEQLARVIRADKIDILIDLTGHIGDGRLQTFAYRPAPVQAAYIGYQATTGLPAIDYVLSDEWADPTGRTEAFWVETPWRLPEPYFAYEPAAAAPAVGPLPSDAVGHITFGCLNNLAKVTPRCVALWCRVLAEVPGARLLLLAPDARRVRDRLHAMFASHGINADRVELVGRQSVERYFETYNRIDLALDPVPFNGHTTTCDAAWMGVPTVSLAGDCYAYRYGGSVMRHLGLSSLVTDNEDEYVAVAVKLANNRPELTSLRMALRLSMQSSAMMNGKRIATNLEAAYRGMWQAWIGGRRNKR